MKQLIIIGAGGHGKVVADIAELRGYKVLFLDDNKTAASCDENRILGTTELISQYLNAEFFVAIGDDVRREHFMEKLFALNAKICTLVHPQSTIARGVSIGVGTVVMAGVVINPGAVLGKGCIINTAATIDHDDIVGDYCHVSVGCHLAGTVTLGNHCWIGIGAVVCNNVFICDNCMVGAGAAVIHNIEIPGVYFGVPARKQQEIE